MADSNFKVKNGLEVGGLTIFAANGAIATTGTISTSSGFEGVDATSISNGTSKVQVYENTTIGFNVGGTANVMTVASSGDVTIAGDLTVNGTTTTVDSTTIQVQTSFTFEGATDDAFETTLRVEDPTADRTVTIPNATGTIVLKDTTDTLTNKSISLTNNTLTFTSAQLKTACSDETGSGALVFGTSPTFTTGVSLPAITKTGSNGVGDIGQSGNKFGTIYGLASSAQYADLAEKYEADAHVEPGTVVHFGGEKEVSQCDVDHCQAVAGVVSTAPAFRMNDDLEAEHVAMVALQGRVPCKVTGPVHKGDMMVSAGNGMARAEANPKVGAVIGKALENWEGGEGTIEVVVGKH